MTTYQGIFIRDQLGQQPGTLSAGWSECPDIIFNGKTVATNPSQFTTCSSYGQKPASTVYINQNNYIYLRGLNTNSTEQKSHMFFYYTESDLMLWPKNWRSDHITVTDQDQNWSLLDANAKQVAVTQQPLVWVPPPLKGSQWDHYCVIVWSDNNPTTPTPPDLATLSQFSSCDELAVFVQQHPGMGSCNTSDVYGTPPNYTYNTGLSFQLDGGTINLSITFTNIPDDGTFSVNLQGTNSSNTIAMSDLSIADYKGGFNVQDLSYPPNFQTSVQVEWVKGSTNPSPAAEVKVNITQLSSPLLIKMMEKAGIATQDIQLEQFQATYPLPGQNLQELRPTPVVLLGRQTWNMKYGVQSPTK